MKPLPASSRVLPTLVWLAVAGLAAGLAWRFPSGNGVAPGPAMIPLVLAILLGGLGCLLAFSKRHQAADTEGASRGTRRTVALVVLMATYVVVMPWLGFISASALLTMAVLRLLGYPHGARGAALGLIAGFLLYGFFAGVMGVPLPKGWLG